MHVIWVTPHFWKFSHSETRNKFLLGNNNNQLNNDMAIVSTLRFLFTSMSPSSVLYHMLPESPGNFFFHSFIGCSSCDIQYKFIIQHTHTHTHTHTHKNTHTKKMKKKPKRGRCNETNVPCEASPLILKGRGVPPRRFNLALLKM